MEYRFLQIKEDKKTKNLFIKFPKKLLKKLNWKTGDSISWESKKDGTYILSKINEEDRKKNS